MEDEKDILPSVHSRKTQKKRAQAPTQTQVMDRCEKKDETTEQDSPIPHYEELHAAPGTDAISKEMAAGYPQSLKSLPDFPWHLDEESRLATPTLAAPYITGHASGVMTEEELVASGAR